MPRFVYKARTRSGEARGGSVTAEGERSALAALERARILPRHVDLSAYHPLGTTRMGVDPLQSVVDMDLRVRGAPRLVVCDGGVIPSSLGVNPQLIIMALSLRAAEALADRLA